MDIEAAAVVRLVEQFLKEHNLRKTLAALQEETGVTINTVDNIGAFKSDIEKGNWEEVLSSVEQASIAQDKLVDLYEQIIFELVELQDLGPARALLRQTEPMEIMRVAHSDRYLRLEQLLSRTSFDKSLVYKGKETKESRRAEIASRLVREVSTAPPSRLVTLLGQAAQWQKQQGVISDGVPYDLFYARSLTVVSSENSAPSKLLATIKFPKNEHPS
ncbi:Serine/threonine-protein kinase smu1, partial [Coemansia sp. RSA 2673]